jgi:hypothetical protein
MSYYSLKVVSNGRILSEPAGSDEQALLLFGKTLGVALTFEGDGPSEYLFGRREEPTGWVYPNIPVYSLSD